MKKLNLFIVLLPLLGACKFATEPPLPIIPPDSIVITSVTIEVTATTATIKTTVTTSKTTTVTVEYGVSSYANTANATPSPINGSMSVSAKISNLTPNTTYKYRIKAGANYFFGDSTFVTSNQLQIGDTWKNGIVISINPGLLAAPVDLTPTWGVGLNYFAAKEVATKYGEGYRLPDSTEAKLIKKAKDMGILTNFVDPNYDSRGIYLTSTEMTGNTDWVFYIGMHTSLNGWINKGSSASSRAVCSF